jgi:RNA polymerase sigma-70 factor (ECF subfamily)
MTGDRSAAEDMVQDVFVRMLKYRSTFRDEGRFETWMFRIARNARADYFRKRAVQHLPDEGVDAVADTPGPARLMELGQDVALLKRALLRLREDRRELIILTRYRGMKHDDIGEMLGIDVGAVKVRIHRAMKELREIYLGLTGQQPCDVKTSPRNLRII